jgi:hypothetical protein
VKMQCMRQTDYIMVGRGELFGCRDD